MDTDENVHARMRTRGPRTMDYRVLAETDAAERLKAAARSFAAETEEQASSFSVFRLVAELGALGQDSAQGLADAIGLTKGGVHQLLRRLAETRPGLINSEPDPRDPRRVLLRLG